MVLFHNDPMVIMRIFLVLFYMFSVCKHKNNSQMKYSEHEGNKKIVLMYYETNCASISIDEWYSLMKGARKCSYQRLVSKIKKELPDLYRDLCLEFYNPFEKQCKQTKTHYILVHSAIEHFIRK